MNIEDAKYSQTFFSSESLAMRIAGALGLQKLRWSIRRLHCPVPDDALVLEVGAGGNPYPRANVLLDAMKSTIERNEKDLIQDRPLVLGLCEELPFKDKSFDFIIASHVLEHTDDPERFLQELIRVGKSGYIETPDGWFEKMCPFTYHRLEVSSNCDRLFVKKKTSWKPDEIASLYDFKLRDSISFAKFMRIHPDLFTMRFYWKDSFDYEIVNPEVDVSWPYPDEVKNRQAPPSGLKSSIRNFYLTARRLALSQNRRNKRLNILDLLRCPSCHHETFDVFEQFITCQFCGTKYDIEEGIPKLFPIKVDGFNQQRIKSKVEIASG